MTPEYLLKKMIEYGSAMRAAQKGFFKEREPTKRKEYLEASKKAEKEFDSLIEQAKLIVK